MSKTPKHVTKNLTAKQVIAKLRAKACANSETNPDGTPKKPKEGAKTDEEIKAEEEAKAAAAKKAEEDAKAAEAAKKAEEDAKACGDKNPDGTPKKPETNPDGTPKKTDEQAKADPVVDVQALMDKISGLESKIDMLSEGLAIVLENCGLMEDAGGSSEDGQTDGNATDQNAAKDIDSMTDEEIQKELEEATAELEKDL